MSESDQHETGDPEARTDIRQNLKAAVIELFKKSQRLPPLSLILRNKEVQELPPLDPPEGFEFGDFYHL